MRIVAVLVCFLGYIISLYVLSHLDEKIKNDIIAYEEKNPSMLSLLKDNFRSEQEIVIKNKVHTLKGDVSIIDIENEKDVRLRIGNTVFVVDAHQMSRLYSEDGGNYTLNNALKESVKDVIVLP